MGHVYMFFQDQEEESEEEELEASLAEEADHLMEEVWLGGGEAGLQSLLALLVREGASVDRRHSQTSATPLMVAAGRGFTGMVAQLLRLGASPLRRASNGWNAIDWARRFHRDEVVELLEAHV